MQSDLSETDDRISRSVATNFHATKRRLRRCVIVMLLNGAFLCRFNFPSPFGIVSGAYAYDFLTVSPARLEGSSELMIQVAGRYLFEKTYLCVQGEIFLNLPELREEPPFAP